MHIIQIIPCPARAREIPLVPGELHPLAVLVEGRGLFAEGVVGVVGLLVAGGVGDQAGGSQVVQVVVAAALVGFGG
jgi:hypothetical protein